MKKLGKAIDKLCAANTHGIKISEIREEFIFLMFVKTVSDFTQDGMYGDLISILTPYYVKNTGATFDDIVKMHLPAFVEYNAPEFTKFDDAFLKPLFLFFTEFNFSDQVYLDNDYVSFAYQKINDNYYKGSANPQLAEFITPPSVCNLMSKILTQNEDEKEEISVYDPCCGTGATFAPFIADNSGKKVNVYGQDINQSSVFICQINVAIMQLKEKFKNGEFDDLC